MSLTCDDMPAPRRAAIGSHHSPRAQSTVWLTPPGVLAALGEFDLDPCAVSVEHRPWPTAAAHIAPPDDGLAAPWSGRVWCNPPYDAVDDWLARLADHGTGTALVFARTETAWFVDTVWARAAAVLFLHGRLHFYRPDGSRAPGNAGGPSCLVAYGAEDAGLLARSGLTGTFVRLRRGRGIV